MPVTITELEARARINRTEWDRDKAALRADIQDLNRQLDTLGQRNGSSTSQALSALTSGTNATPLVSTSQGSSGLVQSSDQATAAVKRLTAAQREAADPVLQQAHAVRDLEGDWRNYARVLGDAHPQTLALKQRLDELKASQVSSGQQTLTLKQQLGQLISTMGEGESSASGFGRGILQEVGGISLIAGGAAAAGAAVAGLIQQAGALGEQFVLAGIAGNSQLEGYQTSLGVILGGTDAAKKRLAELTQFAQSTPFNLPGVVEADKVLQTFGGTALATGKNLTLTGDIAAGTERDFSDVALWVGRAYDALQNGRPWGEAALRLQEMGALSGTARARLEALQASGASGTQVWTAFTEEMSRFNGLMDQQSRTAAGLSSNLQDLVAQLERTATAPLFDRFKQGLQAATSSQGTAQLQGAAQDTSKLISGLIGVGELLVSEYGHQVPDALHDAASAVDWLHKTFGLFGDTMDSNSSKLETFDQQVSRFMASERADRGPVGGASIFKTIDQDFASNQSEIQKALEASGKAMSSQQTTTAQVWQTLQSDLVRVQALYKSDSQVAATTAGEVGRAAKQRADDELATMTRLGTAIEAERQLYASLADSAAFSAQTSAHAASERASRYGTTVPTQQQTGQDILRQQQAGGIIDASAQAQQQAAIDRMRANSSGYLSAQLASEQAQAALQAAMQQVRLGDQSFLQGQVSQQITSTQLSTAIDTVKLHNHQLMDASVQADAAQLEVQAAISRLRGTNGLLLSAQVDSETASTQAATALERAKASSSAYISAQVAAEQAQRDAQDALDQARVKSGLIDYTQTAAYQRARAQMITPVELVKTQIEDVYSVVKTGLDTANTLAGLYIPSNAIDKMKQVTQFEDQLLQAQNEVASKFGKDQILKMFDFAQAAKAEIDYYAAGVTALVDTAKLQAQPPDKAGIDAALGNIDYIYQAIDREAQKHGPEETARAGLFAQTGQSVAGLLSSMASAFQDLNAQRFDLRGQINLEFANMDHALSDLVTYSASWKTKASDANRAIADNAGAIGKDLSDALSPFKDIQAAGMVGSYEIDAAINNVDYALTKMGDLANSPLLQGQSLTRLQQGSSVLGSVFTGLKTATDTLTGLTSLANSTGDVDLSYSLDQFFLTQVPTYADTWEKSMDRIGNASEGVAARTRGAFGLPSVNANASAGGHITGAAGGNVYNLTINGVPMQATPQTQSDIHNLLITLQEHTSLVNGGVPVGG